MKSTDSKNRVRVLKEVGLFLSDILYNAVVIVALVVLIRTFLVSPFRVIGSSMADTLHNGEFILIDKLSYHLGEPKRGDSVVFLPPITNKHSYKFKETVTTDAEGLAVLPIGNLRTTKEVFYCQNPWVKKLWLCSDKVYAGDLAYFQPVSSGNNEISWEGATKKMISAAEVEAGKVEIKGEANQDYAVRLYHSTGPEYFVKRVIGVPGDVIRIENGRVYLKPIGGDQFIEIEENYLNKENAGNTYFRKPSDMDEVKVPEGHYFVMGDNRNHSNDSRHWFSPLDEEYTPYVNEDEISGKVLVVLWPPQDMRLIPAGILQNEELNSEK